MPVVCLVVASGLLVCAGPAGADGSLPWARGVAEDRQRSANALFEEGNQLFGQQAHGPALEKYKEAVALWDHPMIHFNMAVTEIKLDRILDAALDLELALRFGRRPFAPELYEQALDYQRLLGGRIGELEVRCEQPDVKVEVDGKPWLTCPGRRKLRVLAGEHVVVGERSGFLPQSARLVVGGGAVVGHRVRLVSLESAATIEYPTPRWIPWTITGGGAAILLGGLGLYMSGKNQLADFHNALRASARPAARPTWPSIRSSRARATARSGRERSRPRPWASVAPPRWAASCSSSSTGRSASCRRSGWCPRQEA
jgi:hypothetical protein